MVGNLDMSLNMALLISISSRTDCFDDDIDDDDDEGATCELLLSGVYLRLTFLMDELRGVSLRTLFSSTFLADSTTGLLLLPPITTTNKVIIDDNDVAIGS